ncbi:MAG: nucleotidyltransferase family protein [Leptospiraceae bacterium]|nr:nucleotidyltransferase family protein [Leptospiraceae bacterium]
MITALNYDKKVLATFCQKHRLRKLALFGSATRDDFGPQSDVDVLIELPENHKVGLFELFDMEQELAEIFHRKVDLTTFGGLRGALGEEIRNTSKVVYEQTG